MSMFIRLSDGEYPMTLRQVNAAVTNVSFAANPTDAMVSRHGYARVEDTPRPSVERWERAVEDPPEQGQDGVWRRQWRVVTPTIEAEKARATEIVEALARERMFEEMALPQPIQRDLDTAKQEIEAATDIPAVRAAIEGMR